LISASSPVSSLRIGLPLTVAALNDGSVGFAPVIWTSLIEQV